MSRSRLLRVAYAVVIGAVALGGLVTIVEWARQGAELPGGGVPVTGRVVQEQPGFGGALAIVEVAYDAGGKERRARLPVAGSNEHPQEPTYHPGDPVALLVSRTDPDRVQHANWRSDTPPPISGWVVVAVAAAILAALVVPGLGSRLQSALSALGSNQTGPATRRRR
jgi:hypothetical protein